MLNFWDILNIRSTTDIKQIKRAYAKQLKTCRPDDDAQAYQQLRKAFDLAKKWIKQQQANNNTSDYDTIEQLTETDELFSIQQLFPELTEIIDPPKPSILNKPHPESKTMSQVVDELHQQLFYDNDGKNRTCDYFKHMLKHYDELQHLDAFREFELRCFGTAIHWQEQALYPGELFLCMEAYFDWQHAPHKKDYISQHLNDFDQKIEPWRVLASLHKKAELYENGQNTSDENHAAKILLGKFRPRYFKRLQFKTSCRSEIKALIKQLQDHPLIKIHPDLTSDTFLWWEKRLPHTPLTVYHIFFGLFFSSIFPPIVILNYLNLPRTNLWSFGSYFLESLIVAFIGRGLVWGIKWNIQHFECQIKYLGKVCDLLFKHVFSYVLMGTFLLFLVIEINDEIEVSMRLNISSSLFSSDDIIQRILTASIAIWGIIKITSPIILIMQQRLSTAQHAILCRWISLMFVIAILLLASITNTIMSFILGVICCIIYITFTLEKVDFVLFPAMVTSYLTLLLLSDIESLTTQTFFLLMAMIIHRIYLYTLNKLLKSKWEIQFNQDRFQYLLVIMISIPVTLIGKTGINYL
ncbi:MAG: J domain-containing protein [Methylococcales bacterium]|jgi:hypothetical protein|nr:J domain-containing protein [Methylococcales bacterium]